MRVIAAIVLWFGGTIGAYLGFRWANHHRPRVLAYMLNANKLDVVGLRAAWSADRAQLSHIGPASNAATHLLSPHPRTRVLAQ